jgi:hypothetical protein
MTSHTFWHLKSFYDIHIEKEKTSKVVTYLLRIATTILLQANDRPKNNLPLLSATTNNLTCFIYLFYFTIESLHNTNMMTLCESFPIWERFKRYVKNIIKINANYKNFMIIAAHGQCVVPISTIKQRFTQVGVHGIINGSESFKIPSKWTLGPIAFSSSFFPPNDMQSNLEDMILYHQKFLL